MFFYVLGHHWGWTFVVLVLIGIGFTIARKNIAYSIIAFILGMLNVFTGHFVNAYFLNRFGSYGTAIITFSETINFKLNDEYVWRYYLVVNTLEQKDVVTEFTTTTAALYPLRNEILIPPKGERFVVKFIPGFEKNVVIMTDESDYGKRILRQKALVPILKAKGAFEANPRNSVFRNEYRKELNAYIEDPKTADDTLNIQKFKREILELNQ